MALWNFAIERCKGTFCDHPELRNSGAMSLLESQRLRGRMQFADGQLFGRIGHLWLRAV